MTEDAVQEAEYTLEPVVEGGAPETPAEPEFNIGDFINLSSDELFKEALEAGNNGHNNKSHSLFQLLLKRDPDHSDGWGYMGVIMLTNRRFDAAVCCLKRALRLKPDITAHWSNLGVCLMRMNRFEEAREAFERACELEAENMLFHQELSGALRSLGKYDEALESLRRAELLGAPELETRWNRSLLHLMKGEYKTGFEGIEARWEDPGTQVRYDASKRWHGEDLNGRSLVVWVDSGYNDMVMMARFVPELVEKNGTIIFEVPAEAGRLFAESETFKDITIRGHDPNTPAEVDLHIPLMSLPLVLEKTEQGRLNAGKPYLTPPKAPRVHSQKFKVGVVWNGASRRVPDAGRVLPIRHVARLADTPNTEFFSLQRGGSERELQNSGLDLMIANLGSICRDMADIAALAANFDLFIAVDCYQAHILAAMGKKVWLLLGPNADWRWQAKSQTSPWYSNVRLFRRNDPLYWDTLIEKVRADLIKESKASS